MSLLNFLQQKENVKIGNNELGFVVVDCVPVETHNRSATITENEIEDGSRVNDHYRKQPDKLSFTGIVSEVPIDLKDSLTNVATTFVTSKIGGLGGVAATALSGIISEDVLKNSQNRQLDNLLKLEQFMEQASIVTVITGLKRYSSMMIESIVLPRRADLGESLEFNINFKEIRIVQSKTVKLPESSVKGKQKHSATSKSDLGKQKPKEPTAEETKRSSILGKIFL